MGALGPSLLSGPTLSQSYSLRRRSWTAFVNEFLRSWQDWLPTCAMPWYSADLDTRPFCMRPQHLLDLPLLTLSQTYPRHRTCSISLCTPQAPLLPSPVASHLSSLCFEDASHWSFRMEDTRGAASRFSALARHPLCARSSVYLIVQRLVLGDRTSDEIPAVPLVTALGGNGFVRCDRKHLNNPTAQRLDATRDTSPPRETYVRRQLRRRRCHVKPARPNNLRLSPNPRGRAMHGFAWATGPLETVGRIDRCHRSGHSDPGVLRIHASGPPIRSHRPLCVYQYDQTHTQTEPD